MPVIAPSWHSVYVPFRRQSSINSDGDVGVARVLIMIMMIMKLMVVAMMIMLLVVLAVVAGRTVLHDCRNLRTILTGIT